MCGISGIFNFKEDGIDQDLLKEMVMMAGYRGPDDCGLYTDNCVGLAHARLSIIDPAGGRQPIHNEDRSLWITFNGEIFNYVELRQELIKQGHRFSTDTDTEVILHLYEEKGEDCLRYFNGQWAFAIWDKKKRRLFLSRDRIGVRPLFYTVAEGRLLFGSEIKSILVHPGVTREIDLNALDQLFTFWVTLPPRTFFRDIMELPPAHYMIVEDGKIITTPYWHLDYAQDNEGFGEVMDERDYAERLRELLVDATRIRLRSDVPVGAYLSGGLDSAVVTAMIKNHTSTPLKTFSVTFKDPEFDESSYQREASRFFGTEHQDVSCSCEDIARVFPDVVWHTEKPVLRTAPAPLYILSGLVRDAGYKVVLTGEGSDEILGGYDIFKESKIRRFWAMQPLSGIRPLLLKRLYPYMQNLQRQPLEYLQAFFHARPEDLSNPFFSHLPRWGLTSRLKVFYSDTVKSELMSHDSYEDMKNLLPPDYDSWDSLSQAGYLEARYLLPGYILSSQGDRVSMAHSVEGRFPFLDHRVVEFASALPSTLKLKVLNEKYILKLCAGDMVPLSVRNRSKQPYRAPDGKSFFSSGSGKARFEYIEDLLSQERIKEFEIFNPDMVERLVDKFRKGQAIGAKDNMAFVGILSTQLFVYHYIKNFTGSSLNGSS
ncbi:Asparagine synthetase [glutamine-hydrolyzing] [hydrothermal vent metagenome]|uniref:Asparagine synthetase [glutamine-hydrolyzing] n=1 Tax=hydrothermal vent metagenome TaxID=652676 RepID=A0A3B1DLA7_9ZZZZ